LRNEGILDVVEYKPPSGADKIVRLHACSDRFENGRVVLPERAPWLDDYINELIGFPGSKHDDQVDSTTQALDYLREPDIAAEYLRAFGGENVLRFLGRYRPHPRAHR
jgi:phage terminase large subunit-like protein